MILRIFATDGFTPERIFRWSVDETTEHLSSSQVLWVTRLDGPWKPLVDWFIKHPAFRAVILDAANRWDWYAEHEVTWRLANGLLYQNEGRLGEGIEKAKTEEFKAVYWGHDDMAPPAGDGFRTYLQNWLASDSDSMEAPSYQLWDDFSLVREDVHGKELTNECHCWLAKWSLNPVWLKEGRSEPTPEDMLQRFRPLNSVKPWICPWPFRHAKGVDKEFRSFARKGFIDRWLGTTASLKPYDPDKMWEFAP